MIAHRSDLASALRTALGSARNADGGWPYYAGKASRLEPTCAAFLALGIGVPEILTVLDRWPRREGLFVDGAGEINVTFNGLAAIALAPARDSARARDLRSALTREKAVKIVPSNVNRQNNALQGWPWTTGTFSWVESTATCLLGLKRLAPVPRAANVAARITEAEQVLADRVCRQGGWNHGNSNMLGKELPPYIPTTALALLALHDRSSEAAVNRSLKYLEVNRLAESGALALALTRIALGVYQAQADDVEAALTREWERSAFLGNLHTMSLALYAVTGANSSFEAFRV